MIPTCRAYAAGASVEDRFVPEKELVQSDWAALVLDQDGDAGTVTQPLPGEEIYLHHGLFSAAECAKLIDAAEAAGFGFTDYPKDYRGNLRLITNDTALADRTWERMKLTVPSHLQHDGGTWKAAGLNPHWRLSKYGLVRLQKRKHVTSAHRYYPGDVFQRHLDSCFAASHSLRSFYTVNMYLCSRTPLRVCDA
jgi:hypothetical protein